MFFHWMAKVSKSSVSWKKNTKLDKTQLKYGIIQGRDEMCLYQEYRVNESKVKQQKQILGCYSGSVSDTIENSHKRANRKEVINGKQDPTRPKTWRKLRFWSESTGGGRQFANSGSTEPWYHRQTKTKHTNEPNKSQLKNTCGIRDQTKTELKFLIVLKTIFHKIPVTP